MMKLSPRLFTAASFVRGGERTADIGTDHAYLPVYLVESGLCSRCVAADIGVGPLENAAKTLERTGFGDKIELRLSDGLKNFAPREVDEVIICGMGGTLIEDILNASPWVKKNGMHLILQPMTHIENVREYLSGNGFSITDEAVVFDENRYYLTVSAFFTDAPAEYCPGEIYFGKTPFADAGFAAVTAKQYKRLKTRLDAITAVDRFPEERARLAAALDYYERMKKNDG